MNKKVKSVALLAVLSLAAAGCQKENIVEPTNAQIQQDIDVRSITYTIDGVVQHITIYGDDDWFRFIDCMINLAEKGHCVKFRTSESIFVQPNSKEVKVFTTTDKEEAKKWTDEMTEMGYEVTIVFDSRTGVYTCTAVN